MLVGESSGPHRRWGAYVLSGTGPSCDLGCRLRHRLVHWQRYRVGGLKKQRLHARPLARQLVHCRMQHCQHIFCARGLALRVARAGARRT